MSQGYLRRGTEVAKHVCKPPTDGQQGDIWRCACGWRWTCLAHQTNLGTLTICEANWIRRYWPWPR